MVLENIESLIENNGQISVGYHYPVGCVAIANDENNSLAMLQRRPGESLSDLLKRLDQAILQALEYDQLIDEINN